MTVTHEMLEAAENAYLDHLPKGADRVVYTEAMRAALEAAEAARPRLEAFTIEATPEAWSQLFCVPPSPPIQLPAPKGPEE